MIKEILEHSGIKKEHWTPLELLVTIVEYISEKQLSINAR